MEGVDKKNQIFIPVILFWVKKKVIKKGVLREQKGWFSLEFWRGFFGCFLAHKIVRFCETKKVEFRP